MWNPGPGDRSAEKKGFNGIVAVAVDKDRSSQHALKWAVDHILARGQTVMLVHVRTKPSISGGIDHDSHIKDLFLPFRCFCTRKNIQCKDVVLDETDVAEALVGHISQYAIEHFVMGSSSKTGLLQFKTTDVPSTVLKTAPEFCTLYVISKGKISSMRSASGPAPTTSAVYSQMLNRSNTNSMSVSSATDGDLPHPHSPQTDTERSSVELPSSSQDNYEFTARVLNKGRANVKKFPMEFPRSNSIFSVSTGRPSVDSQYLPSYNTTDNERPSDDSDIDYLMSFESGHMALDSSSPFSHSSMSGGSKSPMIDDVEMEMQRLKLELKQTTELYSTACREALIAKQTAEELVKWNAEEERRLRELQVAGEAALMLAHKERLRSKAALEAAEVSRRVAEIEAQKRRNAEMKAIKEAEEKKKIISSIEQPHIQYRKYVIEEIEAATDFFSKS